MTQEATEAAETQRFSMTIDEYVQIDATVTEPEKQAYATHTLKMVDCDPERLFGIFSPEGHDSYTTRDRGYYLAYEEANGKKLVVNYEDYCKIKYRAQKEENPEDASTLLYYYTQEHSQAQPHDLSFMTVKEMESFLCDEVYEMDAGVITRLK